MVSMAARNSPQSSGRNSLLHYDLVTAELPWRCDIGQAIEVEIDDLLQRLGGGAVAQASRQASDQSAYSACKASSSATASCQRCARLRRSAAGRRRVAACGCC